MGVGIFFSDVWGSASAQQRCGCLRHRGSRGYYVSNKKQGPQALRSFSQGPLGTTPKLFQLSRPPLLCSALALERTNPSPEARRLTRSLDSGTCSGRAFARLWLLFSAPAGARWVAATRLTCLCPCGRSPAPRQVAGTRRGTWAFSPLLRSQKKRSTLLRSRACKRGQRNQERFNGCRVLAAPCHPAHLQ